MAHEARLINVLNHTEVKLVEGYQISMFPVRHLVDRQGNILEESIEPQKGNYEDDLFFLKNESAC